MSTVVVVKKGGMVAIAADTLTTFGSRKVSATHNRHSGKILRLGGSFLGMTGWSASQQVLTHAFWGIPDPPRFASAAEIFDVFLALHPRLKQEYFLSPLAGDGYESSHMNLLIANGHGIFGVYSIRDVLEYERFWASGSGSDYALGAMHAVFDADGDAASIAEAGVRAGIEFDDATGGPIEVHVLPLIRDAQADELELLLNA